MLWTYVIIAAVAVVVLLIVFRMVWRVAEPNEALIISGLGAHSSQEQINETLGFKVFAGFVQQGVDLGVEGVTVEDDLLRDRRHELHASAFFVDMHDVHNRAAERGKYRRLWEDHRLRNLGAEPGDVGRAAAAKSEQREVFGMIAAQMHFTFDR